MTARLREYWLRVLAALGMRRVEEDLDAEFAAHREMAAEEYERSGMSVEEARRTAAIRFGGRLAAKEHVATQRGLPGLESLFQDIIQGLRGMRANPRFTVAAIVMLGLSIGVNTSVVTLINAALFKG